MRYRLTKNDEFLFSATRRKDRSQLYGNSMCFSTRAEILEFLRELP